MLLLFLVLFFVVVGLCFLLCVCVCGCVRACALLFCCCLFLLNEYFPENASSEGDHYFLDLVPLSLFRFVLISLLLLLQPVVVFSCLTIIVILTAARTVTRTFLCFTLTVVPTVSRALFEFYYVVQTVTSTFFQKYDAPPPPLSLS